MSDVVAVGVITAIASLSSAAVAALAGYLTSKRNTEAALATARQQADVELEKVKAENVRLRADHGEAERQRRQELYHQLLAITQRLHGWTPGDPETRDLRNEWLFIVAGVQLIGADDVLTALFPAARTHQNDRHHA